jgi:uncharacterized protein YjeT (DUF2065 family)
VGVLEPIIVHGCPSVWSRLMKAIFAPCEWLLRRLTLPQKFALIACS